MSDQPTTGSEGHQPLKPTPEPTVDRRGEGMVWSIISTLVAGPAVWGGIGWAVDVWRETGRMFTAAGVIVGFVTALYLVYVKYGKI